MDEETRKKRIDTQYLGIIGAGIITGMTLVFTYGRTFHYPALKQQPAVVQKVSELEGKLSEDRAKFNVYDPNIETLVPAAQDYVKHRKEYDSLMQRPDVRKLREQWEDDQAKYTLKVHGLGFAPIFGFAIPALFWRSRQYKKYGLNKKVLKQ